jgi:hypothetical protein
MAAEPDDDEESEFEELVNDLELVRTSTLCVDNDLHAS